MTRAEIAKFDLPTTEEMGFDGLYLPANRRSVQRAWYDVFAIDRLRFAVTIGTVAAGGSGDAALKQAMRDTFRETFNVAAAKAEPGTLLPIADAVFARVAATDGLATATIGIVDCADQTFTYVSAGNPPPMIRYADGATAALPAAGPAFGLSEHEHPRAEVVVDVRDALLLVLSSTLLVEQAAPGNSGRRSLHDVLGDERILHADAPSDWIGRRILGDAAHDDMAVLTLTFGPRFGPAGPRRSEAADAEPPRWSVSWSFDATGPASTGARRAFLACLATKPNGGKAVDIAAAELIFGELLGNVVRHAPGPVEITLNWTEESPVLHVLDNGPGFRSRRSRERLPVDALSESGRGLFIVNACATKFGVRNRNGRGTHATATLPSA